MKTITGKITAYLSGRSESSDPQDIDDLAFSTLDMTDHGWVKVGDAEITVSLYGREEITRSQVSMLTEAKRRIQAETQAKINQIDGQIQSLLAIECK